MGAHSSRLETIVLSRFLLNLRRAALRLTISPGPWNNTFSDTTDTVASLSELQFNSQVIGSLGGSLAFGPSDDYSEETEISSISSGQVDMVALESL